MAKTNTSPTTEAAHELETRKAARTKIPTPGLASVHAPPRRAYFTRGLWFAAHPKFVPRTVGTDGNEFFP
jgi:hypothetical protein